MVMYRLKRRRMKIRVHPGPAELSFRAACGARQRRQPGGRALQQLLPEREPKRSKTLRRGGQARTRIRMAIVFFAAAAALGPPGSSQAETGACPNDGPARGKVASVNERLDLILDNGLRLKIASADPPRPTPANPELDVEARERLAHWLTGKEIHYQLTGPGLDRWGRAIAFVFAEDPGGAPLSVGAALLDAGLARYEGSPAALPCRAVLLAAEAGARRAGLGLWADPYYAVIAAADRLSFAEKTGTAVIVEGRITGIADRRPRIMLLFGHRPGWDFSVAVVPRNNKAFDAAYAGAAGLAGRSVRVRGLLDTRFGPQIEIETLDELEMMGPELDAPAASSGSLPPAPE